MRRWAFVAMAVLAVSGVALGKDRVKGTMNMKDVPQADRDDLRNAKDNAGAGLGVFNNHEGHLPELPSRGDDQYVEAQLGQDRAGGAGKHRAVLHVATVKGARKVLHVYYTSDHYETFKEVK